MAKKRARKEQDEASVPISSMIDIIFLLIIFFVVTAAIDKEIEDEKVILASAPHGKALKRKDPRSMTINVRADGTVTIGMSDAMTMQQVSNQLTTAANRWNDVNIPIIIRGDKETQHEHIKRVMDAVTATRLYKVKFNAEVRKHSK